MSGKLLTRTGRPKRLKLEARIELAQRYHRGETPKALAEAYGVSRRHVTRIAKEQRGEGQEVRDPSVAVSFRAAQSEVDAFDTEWQMRGFANRSQALQAVVRARCGLLDLMSDDLRLFSETLQRAQDISDSARVLAKAVQRGKLKLAREDHNSLSELLTLAQETHRALAAMKASVQGRRGALWRDLGSAEAAPDAAGDDECSASQAHGPSLPLGNFEARTRMQVSVLEDRRVRSV
ncbi:helix-turn-helix domain-containing protein [Ruegeria sp. 2205SS24-7]|uniref:helix-turn-helix domain-containing protein n=1 Tax=Ruegeria discodermiae TaxID=3064389 RepID=UPI002742459F|nr:helix-turn-helix domain-containing protein [Ruegeria sp. 2205SS24-7]MDP5218787.1 helix-turn-helix domain-containing protein [Ruegeria sp. 2205SS24-7]